MCGSKADVSLNPFLVRVGVGTHREGGTTAKPCVLIPSWLGWVLERLPVPQRASRRGLNPFLVRVGVGTN